MDLKGLLSTEGATIVDVREPHEFRNGHIEGSLNIPLGQVPHKVGEFKGMSKPLILICRSGNRSGMATMMLQAQGVTDVYNGGGWEDVQAVMDEL